MDIDDRAEAEASTNAQPDTEHSTNSQPETSKDGSEDKQATSPRLPKASQPEASTSVPATSAATLPQPHPSRQIEVPQAPPSPQGIVRPRSLCPKQKKPFFRDLAADEDPSFDAADFFNAMSFFQDGIQNPYHSAPPRKLMRFWTATQKSYYASVLYNQHKLFPHKHIPHMDMEDMPCFNSVLQDLHHAQLLRFCSECIHWNEEIVLQFYATLYVSGDPLDINTWALEWMTEHQHYTMSVPEAVAIL